MRNHIPRCRWELFTGTTCVWESRSSLAVSFGERIGPRAQTIKHTKSSVALVVGFIGEVNLSRPVKLVPCLRCRPAGNASKILEGIKSGVVPIAPARLNRITADDLPAD